MNSTRNAGLLHRLVFPFALVAVIGTLGACSDVPTALDASGFPLVPAVKPGGGGGSTSEPTAEVMITTAVAGTGLYGDGQANPYHGTFNDGNLWISPSCDPFREFVLDLSGQGLPAPFDQPLGSGCGFPPRLTVDEGLIGASEGDVLGGPVPDGSTDMSPSTNYYFDGPDGTLYNVIWQGGICVTAVVANGDGTTTYHLTTDTAPNCPVDLAIQADLVRRKTKGKPGTEPVAGDGSVVAHLDLEVRVIPAP